VAATLVRLNPLLSEAGFSTQSEAILNGMGFARLNPLLSEAGFSTNISASAALFLARWS